MAKPRALDRRFEAILLDWDGTVVANRTEDASHPRAHFEALSAAAMHVAIVTGTTIEHVNDQLRARPSGPGELLIACNRGSELFRIDADGPHSLARRVATVEEDAALDRAAAATRDAYVAAGLADVTIVSRFNRRKIDLLPEWNDPPKAEIDRLLARVTDRLASTTIGSLAHAVAVAEACSADTGLRGARITSDAKHVEIGITDKRDAVAAIRERWLQHGLSSGLIAILGDEFGSLGGVTGSDALLCAIGPRAQAASVGVEPEGVPDHVLALGGGPRRVAAFLVDQILRRQRGELPLVDRDSTWTVAFPATELDGVRTNEALAALTDGHVGTRAVAMHGPRSEIPMALIAGAYVGEGDATTLLPAPELVSVHPQPEVPTGMLLDLRTGIVSETDSDGAILGVRFFDPGHEGVLTMRDNNGPAHLATPMHVPPNTMSDVPLTPHPSLVLSHDGTSTAAVLNDTANPAGTRDRTLAFANSPDVADRHTAAAITRSFDARLDARRRTSATRWGDALLTCPDDQALQRDLRYAAFHLMQCAPVHGEAFIGARGLTGPAYQGHIFWDAEVFIAPFLAATNPPAARSILEYRIRRLDAARSEAAATGYRGARFPWESAADGTDVTPTAAKSRSGAMVPIRNGALEIHNVAAVAWATREYVHWSGDRPFAAGPGQELLTETARYWASRIRLDDNQRGHIYGVTGPDEYHDCVDDNAFTNGMAAANLRWAADNADAYPNRAVPPEERARWRTLASTLVDGFRPELGIYEQFAGFFDLEPLVIAEIAPRRPIAADLLLGAERVHQAQVIKQADVLMLHHLIPDDTAPNSLVANLAFYEPRTAHGSSLSPGIHATLFARAGRSDEALALLKLATRIDLDDITDTTAQGLHLATMGSVWQAWVIGLLGCRAGMRHLAIDPHVPEPLGAISATVRYQGTRVIITADATTATVAADGLLALQIGTNEVMQAGGIHRWRHEDGTWEVTP